MTKRKLPTGIYQRGTRLYCRIKVDGKWESKPTPYNAGDDPHGAKAARYLKAAQATLDANASAPGAVPITVKAFAAAWVDGRRALDLDWQNDESRLRHHVLPVIGDLQLADVRSRHIVDLFRRIRTSTERPVAQRTVYNIYSVVSALFRDAKLEDQIEQTPCELTSRQLGPLADKDPEWRPEAVFTRDEVEMFISDPRIPVDRQMVYALEFLAGLRHGEMSGLRWRHYDQTLKPLGQLLVAVSYSSAKGRVKSTKTEAIRYVPVHPTLAAMLAEWKLAGWAAMI
jgi:integrase